MPKRMTMWETKDGAFFHSDKEAIHHESMYNLRAYINDHPIDSTGIDSVNGQDIIDWLKSNNRLHLVLLPKDNEVTSNESDSNL